MVAILGGLGTCFTISHPIGCNNRHNYRNKYSVPTTKSHCTTEYTILIYISPWPTAHLSSVGHVLNRSRQESLLHVKHDTTYPSGRDRRIGHSSHFRAIVPLMPSGLEGLIWGSTKGSIFSVLTTRSTGFSDRVVFFFPCVMQQNASKFSFSFSELMKLPLRTGPGQTWTKIEAC